MVDVCTSQKPPKNCVKVQRQMASVSGPDKSFEMRTNRSEQVDAYRH